jgi:hypothetical protein
MDLIGNDDMLRLVAATDLDRTQMFEGMIDGPIDDFESRSIANFDAACSKFLRNALPQLDLR